MSVWKSWARSKMLTIKNKTRKEAPTVSFLKLKDFVLGSKYELSLVLVGDTLSKRLNSQWRKKNYPTNILSFPYGKDFGEIFLNLAKAEREAVSQKMSLDFWLSYLFVHGLLHLKGFDHSSRMESEEEKILRHFNLHGTKHHHGDRHRNIVNKSGGLWI